MTDDQLRADIVEVGRRLYARGYVASNDGNISVRLDADRLLMTPKSVCKGFMTPDMMVRHRSRRAGSSPGDRDAVVRDADAPRGLPPAARRPGRRARASADRDRLRRRRHPARPRGARRGGDDARQHSDRGVRDAVDARSCPRPSRKYIKAHDGMLLANHGALTLGTRPVRGVLQDGDDRALREDQPGRAACSAASTCSRAKRSSGCRGCAARTASPSPAPICPDPMPATADADPTCQVVQAPVVAGARLVPDTERRAPARPRVRRRRTAKFG